MLNMTLDDRPAIQERQRRLYRVGYILLLPLLIPVFCLRFGGQCLWSACTGRPIGGYCGTVGIQARQRLKEEEERQKEAPPALPAVRKRSLTLPLPPRTRLWQRKQGTADQQQSSFFARFPPEIRQLIYNYYLSGDERSMHVFRRTDRRLAHYLCDHPRDTHFHMPRRAWGYRDMSCTNAWQKDEIIGPVVSNSLLPLLKTCRRVYSEAIQVLYTTTRFCFQDEWTLKYFLRTVLPRRLKLISTIQLPWMRNHLGYGWSHVQVIETVEQLRPHMSLQEITIVSDDDQGRWWSFVVHPQEKDLLAKILQTQPRMISSQDVVCAG
ncbi:MAG: hypothetical protein L6R39_003304 [Caloplaca ligustica]|nr:MAG: hypothetical protein L6R39_003304 [Caloplaca ligustica]